MSEETAAYDEENDTLTTALTRAEAARQLAEAVGDCLRDKVRSGYAVGFDYDGDVAVSYEGASKLAICIFTQAHDAESPSGEFDVDGIVECLETEWLREYETQRERTIVFADSDPNATQITDDQIRTLGCEAAAHGDLDMWAITQVARGADPSEGEPGTALAECSLSRTEARAECERVIAEARGGDS